MYAQCTNIRYRDAATYRASYDILNQLFSSCILSLIQKFIYYLNAKYLIMKITRGEFLKTAGLSVTASFSALSGFSTPASKRGLAEANLKLGLASYTLRKFTLDEVI